MSIEGMWAVYFGDVGGLQVNSGIAVLETGRILGGDSMMAYLGNYVVSGGDIAGKVKIWAFNPHQVVVTAFGNMGTPEGEMLNLDGKYDGHAGEMGEITGFLWEASNPDQKIPAKLMKVADLPN